jgi:hypothetical protein
MYVRSSSLSWCQSLMVIGNEGSTFLGREFLCRESGTRGKDGLGCVYLRRETF